MAVSVQKYGNLSFRYHSH